MVDANEVIDEAEPRYEKAKQHLRDAAEFFHNKEGELFKRSEAASMLAEQFGVSKTTATDILSELVADTVDPVIQVERNGQKYVGVAEFKEFDGAYGYIEYNDRFGKSKRIVCQQCVNQATHDTEVTHATENDPTGTFPKGASYDELLKAIHTHYKKEHKHKPSKIKTGASLITGTTIGGNTTIHTGNESSLSFFDGTSLTASNSIYRQNSAPSQTDGIWVDTSESPPSTKVYDNGLWQKTGYDFRKNINDIYKNLGLHKFELGLSQLEYNDGQFDIYVNENKISSFSNTYLSGSGENSALTLILDYVLSNMTQVEQFGEAYSTFSHNGDYFAKGGSNLTIYSARTLSVIETINVSPDRELKFSPNDQYLAASFASNDDGEVRIYDTSDWSLDRTINVGQPVAGISFSDDGQYFAVARGTASGDNKRVRIYDRNDGYSEEESFYDSTIGDSSLSDIEFSKDSSYLVFTNGTLYIYNVSDWTQVEASKNASGELSFSEDGQYLSVAKGYNGNEAGILSVGDWSEIQSLNDSNDRIYATKFSRDNKYVAIGGWENKAYIYKVSDWSLEETINDPDSINDIAIANNNKYISLTRRIYKGTVTSNSAGSAEHISKNLDFVPSSVVLSDSRSSGNWDIDYRISDANSNEKVISESEIDTEIDISNFTSSEVTVQAELDQLNSDTTPKIYNWAVYFN